MGSTKVEAPPPRDIAQEGQDTLASQIKLAPEQFAANSLYGPQYAQLYQNILGQTAPQLQNLQGQLNTQQRQSDINDVTNLGPQALAAYKAANPGLSSIQDAFTQRALSGQNPISMMGPADQVTGAQTGSDLTPYSQVTPGSQLSADQVGAQQIGAQRVRGQNNIGSQYLLGNTLSELSKGGSLSNQEMLGVTDSVLNRFNMAGRANDPSAIAETALGLDSAQQARLTQRQNAVAQASGLYQNDINSQQQARLANQATSLAASQSNQDAALRAALANQGSNLQAQQGNLAADMQSQLANQNAGLNQQGLQWNMANADANRNQQAALANQQYNYQTAGANQQAQLANANYQNQLLSSAGQFNLAAQQDPYSLVLGRSNAAQGAAAGAGYQGSSQFDPFSAYGSDLYNTNYNAQAAANISTANNNSGLIGGGIKAVGELGGAAIGAKLFFACIPEGELIDTPNGPRTIQELHAGDTVTGYNGDSVTVLHKHEYQENPEAVRFIRFKQADGSSFAVCDMHRVGGIRARDLETDSETERFGGVTRSYDILTEDGGYRMSGQPVNSMIGEMSAFAEKLENLTHAL